MIDLPNYDPWKLSTPPHYDLPGDEDDEDEEDTCEGCGCIHGCICDRERDDD